MNILGWWYKSGLVYCVMYGRILCTYAKHTANFMNSVCMKRFELSFINIYLRINSRLISPTFPFTLSVKLVLIYILVLIYSLNRRTSKILNIVFEKSKRSTNLENYLLILSIHQLCLKLWEIRFMRQVEWIWLEQSMLHNIILLLCKARKAERYFSCKYFH